MYHYFANIKEGQINILRDATSTEYNTLEPHVQKISKMLIDKNRITPVLNAHKELTDAIFNLSTELETTAAQTIQNKLSQFLFEFKKLIDNWETELKRKYGNKSFEFKLYKDAQANEYENHMEYRIMYRLRNYDQHCGSIISRITSYLDPQGNKDYRILMNRDNLLNNFDEWKKPEIDHLRAQDEYIEVRPYISQFMSCILNIFERIMQIHINESLLDSCAFLISAANEFDDEDNIHLISTESEFSKEYVEQAEFPLNFTHLFIPLCKELLVMHFKNNAGPIKVLYYGNAYKQRLKDFALEIKKEAADKISSSHVIDLYGQKLIRAIYIIHFDTGNLYALFIDAKIKQPEQKNIINTCSKYLQVLCKS